MKNFLTKLIPTLFFLSTSSVAGYDCYGEVDVILQYSNGDLNVRTSYRDEYTVFCNLETRRLNVSPETCKGMLSILLTAKASNKKIITYYNSHTCETLPIYGSAPAPVYVGLYEQ